MKIRILLLTFLAQTLFSLMIFGQAPDSFSYQAVLRDASGDLRANTNVAMEISIIQDSTTGVAVYTETHNATTNDFGLVNLQIGGGTVVYGSFTSIDWSDGPYFVKISVDGTDFGTSQLLSVPYAKYAETSGQAESVNYYNITNPPANLDTDRTNDVTTSGNQSISGAKTFTGTVVLTNKQSKFMFTHFDYNVHWNSTSHLSIERYPYYSLIRSDNASEYWVIIPLDMPYRVLGCEQLLDSISFGYQCESAAVSITDIIVAKNTLSGNEPYLFNYSGSALTSTTATRYTFNINSTNDSYTGRNLFMLLKITYTGIGATNELYLYEVEVTTK